MIVRASSCPPAVACPITVSVSGRFIQQLLQVSSFEMQPQLHETSDGYFITCETQDRRNHLLSVCFLCPMAQQAISQSFVIEIYKSLRSYPVAAKIAVVNGGVRGLGVAMAQACVMAKMAHIVLVDVDEKCLRAVKSQLELTMNEFNARTKIHTCAASEMEPERIASIFFSIRYKIGIPDLLLLGYKQAAIDKPVLEYTTDDVSKCFDLDDKTRKSFVYNFLAPGTKQRKSLITVAVVRDTETGSKKHNTVTHFLAHAKTHNGDTWFTVHDLMCDPISARSLKGSFAANSSLHDDCEYILLGLNPAKWGTQWMCTVVLEYCWFLKRLFGCSTPLMVRVAPPSSAKYDRNLDRQISIVDDLVSLCTRQERRPRKPRRLWEDNTVTGSSDDTDVDIKSECSDSDVLVGCQFLLQC